MSERLISQDILKRLGLDPEWPAVTIKDDETGEIWINGKCQMCDLTRQAVYNPSTGETTAANCPNFEDPSAKHCFWRQKGPLPIGES